MMQQPQVRHAFTRVAPSSNPAVLRRTRAWAQCPLPILRPSTPHRHLPPMLNPPICIARATINPEKSLATPDTSVLDLLPLLLMRRIGRTPRAKYDTSRNRWARRIYLLHLTRVHTPFRLSSGVDYISI